MKNNQNILHDIQLIIAEALNVTIEKVNMKISVSILLIIMVFSLINLFLEKSI